MTTTVIKMFKLTIYNMWLYKGFLPAYDTLIDLFKTKTIGVETFQILQEYLMELEGKKNV